MQENVPGKVKCRQHCKEDTNFVYATWLNSYYFGSRFTERITKTIYFEYHRQIVDRILNSPSTEILIACSSEDENTIFGYMVIQNHKKPIIHYMYVKGPFQKLGIGNELLIESGLDLTDCYFTHWTFDTNWIIDKYPKLTYNPYLV